jgi:hypothetical protein
MRVRVCVCVRKLSERQRGGEEVERECARVCVCEREAPRSPGFSSTPSRRSSCTDASFQISSRAPPPQQPAAAWRTASASDRMYRRTEMTALLSRSVSTSYNDAGNESSKRTRRVGPSTCSTDACVTTRDTYTVTTVTHTHCAERGRERLEAWPPSRKITLVGTHPNQQPPQPLLRADTRGA